MEQIGIVCSLMMTVVLTSAFPIEQELMEKTNRRDSKLSDTAHNSNQRSTGRKMTRSLDLIDLQLKNQRSTYFNSDQDTAPIAAIDYDWMSRRFGRSIAFPAVERYEDDLSEKRPTEIAGMTASQTRQRREARRSSAGKNTWIRRRFGRTTLVSIDVA